MFIIRLFDYHIMTNIRDTYDVCEYCLTKRLFDHRSNEDQKKCRCLFDWNDTVKTFVDWCIISGLEIPVAIVYPMLSLLTLIPRLLDANVSVEYAINRKHVQGKNVFL